MVACLQESTTNKFQLFLQMSGILASIHLAFFVVVVVVFFFFNRIIPFVKMFFPLPQKSFFFLSLGLRVLYLVDRGIMFILKYLKL